MTSVPVTIAGRIESGWECVDDAGHRVVVPSSTVDPALRELRVGQRLVAEVDANGALSRVTLP